ncbi:hypothetical protein FRC04_003144 [Tulasnella sp. 424]|nr:hypothetical protein FRC04_003144 [Tulasnella sp. 424]
MPSPRRSLTVFAKVPDVIQLKEVVNTMVECLAQFASKVTISEVALHGTWQELCRTVNKLSANLMDQVRTIASVTKPVALGPQQDDRSRRARRDLGAQADCQRHGDLTAESAGEVLRVSPEVGMLGNLGGQLTNNANKMCLNLTASLSIATVTTAVAKGDFSQRIEIEAEGEMTTLKDTTNSTVLQFNSFGSESLESLEVGTMGVVQRSTSQKSAGNVG